MADFTIRDVLGWARTKPADEPYSYSSITNCALCQFLRHKAIEFRSVGGTTWIDGDGHSVPIPDGVAKALVSSGDCPEDWDARYTFGRLVKRLEKLCPETPVTQVNWLAVETYLSADCGEYVA